MDEPIETQTRIHEPVPPRRNTELHSRIDRDMSLRKPNPFVAWRLDSLRAKHIALAHEIANLCPPSREQSLALTNIEQSLQWSIAAIVRSTELGQPAAPALDDVVLTVRNSMGGQSDPAEGPIE